MQADEELAGWVELEGCFNFRDLGAYRSSDGRRLVPGRVFRSDGLQRLTPADVHKLCGEMGLGEVIDLRSRDEVIADGLGPIAEHATVHSVPLFPKARGAGAEAAADFVMPANMGELYFAMLTAAMEPIAEVIRLIARSRSPIVFHCAAGKDRTGVIAAVIFSLLDVPAATIVADYAFSRRNIDAINARLGESATYQRFMQELPEGAYDADPEAMRLFLKRLEADYGSVEAWADAAGLDAEHRSSIREKLLR